MSYRSRSIESTPRPTGRMIDGAATQIASHSIASLTVGNHDSASLSATATALGHLWGGSLRANGDFLPVPGRGTVQTNNWMWQGVFILVSGNYRIRTTVQSAFTGAGNTLTDGVVVIEFIP